jgi:transposase
MTGKRSGKTYRPWEPESYREEVYRPIAKLPEGDLVFFLIDTVKQLDLSRFYAPYEKERRGAPPFDPAMLVCLLLYAYCVGVFTSRKIAQACERNLAFLAIVGQARPDFRTISDFRKQHLEAFAEVFVQVLRIAGEAGLVKLGNVSTDGTKVQGNASRHKAMSYGHMKKEVVRLRAEIDALLDQAQQQDVAEEAMLGVSRGDELPAELERREQRLGKIEAAMKRLEAQAKQEAEEERRRRAEADAERERQGKKRRGKAPKPVSESPDDKAQMSFTDADLKIMRTNNKGWDYCGNAQASVDDGCQIILACEVCAESNDKQQAHPLGEAIQVNLNQAGIELPKDEAEQPQPIPASLDSGYYSAQAVEDLQRLGFDPYIATGREAPGAVLSEAGLSSGSADANPASQAAEAEVKPATSKAAAKAAMTAKLRTPEGRALYGRRKVIVEPVFGQIKEVRGFRRFLLRGLDKVRGEWRLVCLTHNLLKLWRYGEVAVSA